MAEHKHDALECKEIFSLLSQYLDGELSAVTCREIDEHIRGCAPCVEFLKSLRKSVELTRGHESGEQPGPMPAGFCDALRKIYASKVHTGQA